MQSLDRFDSTLLDSPDYMEFIGECPYCGSEIYEGYTCIIYDGDVYCDSQCFIKGIGAVEVG